MVVRLANFEDLKGVLRLFKELDTIHARNRNDIKHIIPDKRYLNEFKKAFIDKNSILIVADFNREVIGFALGKLFTIKDHLIYKDQLIGEISYIAVDQNHRREGVGGKLIDDIEIRLKLIGATKFEQRVYCFNKETIVEQKGYTKKIIIYEKY